MGGGIGSVTVLGEKDRKLLNAVPVYSSLREEHCVTSGYAKKNGVITGI